MNHFEKKRKKTSLINHEKIIKILFKQYIIINKKNYKILNIIF